MAKSSSHPYIRAAIKTTANTVVSSPTESPCFPAAPVNSGTPGAVTEIVSFFLTEVVGMLLMLVEFAIPVEDAMIVEFVNDLGMV